MQPTHLTTSEERIQDDFREVMQTYTEFPTSPNRLFRLWKNAEKLSLLL